MRKIAALFAAMLLLVPAAACSAKAASEQTAVTIAFFPNITHAQALIGKAEGTFQTAFGDAAAIEWKMFNAGPSEMEALFAGEVDIGYIGPGPAINGYFKSQGDVLILAGATDGGAILVSRSDSDIQSIADLDGKVIAVPQFGNTQDLLLRNLLAENGLSDTARGGTVEIRQAANPDIQALFDKGDLDAALVPEPWGSLLAASAGAHVVLDFDQIWRDGRYPTAVVVVRKEFMKEHPDLVEKFIAAHVEISEYIISHPTESKAALNTQMEELTGKSLSAEVLDASFDRLIITVDPNTRALADLIQFSVDAGNIKDVTNKEGLSDLSVLNKVLTNNGQSRIS